MRRRKNYVILLRGLSKHVPRETQRVLIIVDGDRLPAPAAVQALVDLPGEIKKGKAKP